MTSMTEVKKQRLRRRLQEARRRREERHRLIWDGPQRALEEYREEAEGHPGGLRTCPSCGKTVPPTQYCIVCGGPIPAREDAGHG